MDSKIKLKVYTTEPFNSLQSYLITPRTNVNKTKV